VGQQIQPIAGAVGQYDLPRIGADQLTERCAQLLRDLEERLFGHAPRIELLLDRLARRLSRRERQRPLMGGVQPRPGRQTERLR
jgi:hypothetical protein